MTPAEHSFHPRADKNQLGPSRAHPIAQCLFLIGWLKTEPGPSSSWKFNPQIPSLELPCSSSLTLQSEPSLCTWDLLPLQLENLQNLRDFAGKPAKICPGPGKGRENHPEILGEDQWVGLGM